MVVNQIAVRLTSAHGPLKGYHVTPNGLQGLFHHVLKTYDPRGATWLHDHVAPKPYTLAAAHYDRQRRKMAGILISTLSADAADLIIGAWRRAYEKGDILRFGKPGSPAEQPCAIVELMPVDTSSYERLSTIPAGRQLGLEFLTPTAFSQGAGELLFPLPRNVFARPFDVWQLYAPVGYQLPHDWLDWCNSNVFCTRHSVRTVQKNINRRKRFRGFTGKAWFQTAFDRRDKRPHPDYTRALFALGNLAGYSGIGRKTTMGMGAVQAIG